MNPHDWFVEQRTSYVIRTLEPDEERTFATHLTGCPECRAEIARIERELAWLPLGADPVTPRPGLERRLVERVLGPRPSRWERILPLAAAASLALALGAWGWAVRQNGAHAEQMGLLRAQLTSLQDTVAIMRNASRVVQASIELDSHQGGLLIFADERTHRWNVVVHGLPAAHAGEIYQFWFITETGMVRSVEVPLTSTTPWFTTLEMPRTGGHVMGAALTMEPAGSPSPAPQGKELAHLML